MLGDIEVPTNGPFFLVEPEDPVQFWAEKARQDPRIAQFLSFENHQ